MTDTEARQMDETAVAHQLGILTGSVRELHSSLSSRIDDIRADVRALAVSQQQEINQVEQRLTRRIEGLESCIGGRVDRLENRIVKLEDEDKNFLKASSKAGGVSGGVVGALVAGGVELIKHLAARAF